jgi:hypothetical protein
MKIHAIGSVVTSAYAITTIAAKRLPPADAATTEWALPDGLIAV